MTGRFPSAWLDDLYSHLDIVQIVSSYLPLKKDGRRYWGLCPFHHEKTASFSVNSELNLYYCFGCKAGGNAVQFVMEMEKMSFYEAVKYLAEQTHMPLPEMDKDPDYERRQSQKQRLYAANRAAAQLYHQFLWTDEGKSVRDYLYKRGLDDGTIRKFGLGASSAKWDLVTQELMHQGFTQEELRLAGLTVVKEDKRFDMFRNRAMFPIINLQGQVLGFGGRAMGDAQPKYLNTSDTPVFNKRLGVYAINLLKKQRDLKRIILVEGYMDVVALTQAGVNGVVATLGTALTPEQARLLKRFAPEVWLSYDGDSAGQHAIMRGLDIFEQEAIPTKVLFFPDNLDPDEFIRQRGEEAFDELKPMTTVAYKMMRQREECDLSTQDGRTEYAKKCAVILKKVRDPVEVENYLRDLVVQTGFSRDVLLAQLQITLLPQTNNNSPQRERLTANRFVRREADDSIRTAEKTLLFLMGTHQVPDGMVKKEDFTNETMQHLAEGLQNGKKPAAMTEEDDSEAMRSLVAEIFTSNGGEGQIENAPAIAQDCLARIRIYRTDEKIKQLTQDMSTVQGAEKLAVLKEIQTLTAELKRMKQAGR